MIIVVVKWLSFGEESQHNSVTYPARLNSAIDIRFPRAWMNTRYATSVLPNYSDRPRLTGDSLNTIPRLQEGMRVDDDATWAMCPNGS